MGADRRTDMTKLIVAFRCFADAPKIWRKGGKVEIVSVRAEKACGELEVQFHAFLTSAPDGDEWLASRPRPL